MHESTYTTTFDYDVETVYNKVVDHANHTWREDITDVEVVDENTFIETSIDGSKATVRVINRIPNELYEYTMESDNYYSHWTGRFRTIDEKVTEFQIEEELLFKKRLISLVSRFIVKLSQIHQGYTRSLAWTLMEDEEKELGNSLASNSE